MDEYYHPHREATGDEKFAYSDRTIYSPKVPVIRLNEELLSEPFCVSFITTPAPNARELLRHGVSKGQITNAMKNRILQVLRVAVAHEHDGLVLGAFGCGVFGNNPADVAWEFHRMLTTEFQGVFKHIIFAVLDHSEGCETFNSFDAMFSS